MAPAGWYPDPEQVQTQRYWDGERWTDQRAPLALASKEPVALTPRLGLGILGAVVIIIGTFLPRVDSPGLLHIAGNSLMQSGDGIVLIVFALGGAAAAFRAGDRPGRVTALIVLGLFTMAQAYYNGSGDRVELLNGLGERVEGSAGVGVWAVGIGGAMLLLAGAREWNARPTSPAEETP
jgi:hypothetical protein